MNVRFLMMSSSRNAGGIYFAVKPLAQHLAANGCKCRIIAPRDEFTDADKAAWNPVEVDSFDVVGPASLGFSSKINSLIGTPDIQHAHGIWMYQSRVNRLTALKNNTPYVVSPHGMLDPWAVKNSRWKKRIVGWLYENRHLRDADCIHALCESEANSIREFGLKNPICVIPNAVEIPDVNQIRRDIGENTNSKKQLLFIGRIHPKKGLVNLINAFANLDPSLRTDWEVVIAGWDQNHQQDLESLAKERGVSESIHFPGPQFGEQKEQLLRTCDAFVLPSFSEGLPMSVLEAWSYARPTLITTACNLPEGQLSQATVECEPNEQSIQTGLESLFGLDEPARCEMGLSARELTEQKFAWPVVSTQMIEVYQWLLGEAPPPKRSVFFQN